MVSSEPIGDVGQSVSEAGETQSHPLDALVDLARGSPLKDGAVLQGSVRLARFREDRRPTFDQSDNFLHRLEFLGEIVKGFDGRWSL